MTLNQIECFEAVCRTMSFSKAANALYISQPAISKSVGKLERELGVALFEQSNNTLSLTEAGELFLQFVRRTRREYESLTEELERLGSLRSRTVRLGCPETWNPDRFAPALEAAYIRMAPDFRLRIEGHKLSDLLLLVESGKLDAALTHDFFSPNLPGMTAREITRSRTGVLYAKSAFPAQTDLPRLAQKPFLVYDADIEKRFGAVIQLLCEEKGFRAQIENAGSLVKALFRVSAGTGVMLFTDWDLFVDNARYGYCNTGMELPVKLIYYPERLTAPGNALVEAAETVDWG